MGCRWRARGRAVLDDPPTPSLYYWLDRCFEHSEFPRSARESRSSALRAPRRARLCPEPSTSHDTHNHPPTGLAESAFFLRPEVNREGRAHRHEASETGQNPETVRVMAVRRVGIIGWRGMVGSVLLERMRAEHDFDRVEPVFFSTSQVGAPGPDVGHGTRAAARRQRRRGVRRPRRRDQLPGRRLHEGDAPGAARGRLHRLLDRRGLGAADEGRQRHRPRPGEPRRDRRGRSGRGVKDYIGGNCTVSLMLMATAGLFAQGWVEWVSTATYQAASGAGAKQMRELVAQMKALGDAGAGELDSDSKILTLDRLITATMRERLPDHGARRAPRRQPDSLDRQRDGERPDARGVEGHRRDEQDPRHQQPRSRSTASASASARCAATRRR